MVVRSKASSVRNAVRSRCDASITSNVGGKIIAHWRPMTVVHTTDHPNHFFAAQFLGNSQILLV